MDECVSAESKAQISSSDHSQKNVLINEGHAFPPQRDPPIEVHDLFTDIQDGKILMGLLEELSGCRLVRIMLFKKDLAKACLNLATASVAGVLEAETHQETLEHSSCEKEFAVMARDRKCFNYC